MNKAPLKRGQKRIGNPKKTPQHEKPVKTNHHYDLVGLAAILLLGFIIYSNSFNCSFHFDDNQNILNNVKIRDLWNVKAWWEYSPSRAIGFLTFALNYHFSQYSVWSYHLVNLSIHLINSCLVWWLTLLIFSSPALRDHPLYRQKKMIAFFTALLFVSHPLATQSVTYIIQRVASMAAMFYLLSIALYMRARLNDVKHRVKYFLFAGSFLSAVAAMLTKENAFTLPFAVILAELFFFRTRKISVNFKDYRVLLLTAGLIIFILLLAYFKSAINVFNPIGPHNGHIYTITPVNYLLTQFSVIVKYIQILFLPVNQMVDYDFPISNNFFEIRTLVSFLILLFLIICGVFLFKKQRVVSFGIFWFFLTLLVESSIIPIADVIFEHRTYLPSFGFFLIFSSTIFLLFKDKYKSVAVFILLIIAGWYSWLTYERNKVWKDDLSLWGDNVTKTPNLARPYCNRGIAYGELGLFDKSVEDYSRAIEINPNFPDAYYNRGVGFGNLNQVDKAIVDYTKTVELDPSFEKAYYNRGNKYEYLKQWDKAISDYSKTIEIDPNFSSAYINRGIAYEFLKQWDNAISDCSRALEIDPNDNSAYYNRGLAYANIQQWDHAIADYTRALEIDPNFTKAYNSREIAYKKLESMKKNE